MVCEAGNSTGSAVKMNLLKVGTPVEAKVSHICIPTQPGAPKKKASKKSAGIQVDFMGPLKGRRPGSTLRYYELALALRCCASTSSATPHPQ